MATPPRTPMPPRTVDFEQKNIIKSFAARHSEGVCFALVVEWLSNGGDLSKMRLTRGKASTERINKLQDLMKDKHTAFREYGLSEAGDPFETDSAEEMAAWVCNNRGCYQVGLYGGGRGHAIGAITRAQRGQLFDPNSFEKTYDGNLALYRTSFQGVLEHYQQEEKLAHLGAYRLSPLLAS